MGGQLFMSECQHETHNAFGRLCRPSSSHPASSARPSPFLSADVADDRRWKKCRCKFTNFSSPTSALICDICGQQPPARISPIPKPAQVALSEPYVMSVLV